MSSAPDVGDPFTTTVKRVAGGLMSNWMNDTLRPGSTIEVMRPTGLFVQHSRDVPIVAFAGGSGITPVMSIIKSALATTDREIVLVYANRDPDSVIFRDAIDGLQAARRDRLIVHHHHDSERGFLDADACAGFARDLAHADFYICGPAPYMDTVEAGLDALGVASAQRFIERFVVPESEPVVTDTPVPDELVIRIERRKHTIKYHPGDTVLQTARRGGLNPPSSCEQGNCATCMAHLDQGSVAMHVNNALDDDELTDGWILTCQSVPTSTELTVSYDD
jgi:ferredoxin-NADP reductase